MRSRRAAWSLLGALALVVLGSGPARAAAGGDPPGNNGTVKIDGKPFDDAPDNEAHPGCVFQVDFYGFDAGDLNADVTFEAVAPTAGGELLTDTVPIGEDSHRGGGSEAGLDASKTYDLSAELAGIQPQRNQGWHVRLTVHADGSQGSDVKHKVFWVDNCADTSAAAAGAQSADNAGPAAPDTGTGADVAPSGATPAAGPVSAPPASVMAAALLAPPVEAAASETASPVATGTVGAAAAAPAQVLGETITRSPASTTGPSVLARTGIGLGLVFLALLLIGGGIVLARLGAPSFIRLHS